MAEIVNRDSNSDAPDRTTDDDEEVRFSFTPKACRSSLGCSWIRNFSTKLFSRCRVLSKNTSGYILRQVGRANLVGGNDGWANVFAKVLTQNPKLKKSKKTVVLSKARKDAELECRKELVQLEKAKPKKRKAREPMEIVDDDGKGGRSCVGLHTFHVLFPADVKALRRHQMPS